MPSPLAHAAAGYLIYRAARHWFPELDDWKLGPIPGLLAVTTGVSLLPDIDFLPGLLEGEFAKYHNQGASSLLVGVGLGLIVAGVAALWRKPELLHWAALLAICYNLHIVMDYFTVGRGVMAFWPFTAQRFSAPVMLFLGVQRGGGLWNVAHLWTLVNEVLLAGLAILLVQLFGGRLPRRASQVEPDG